ncbi:unnamed protein product [Pleuronectes platessa]|uniref:Uncharacterized protein n=1 Tax=Pleuronectes platessa TaxID=8262 RepID=A0A9N7Y6U9_PLEPL|nr:unnamed protein product [Pleuronectes platessa]
MGKTKTSVTAADRRKSPRLAVRAKPAQAEAKTKPVAKKGPKAKKAKATENGNPKAEEPKAEATEAK